MHCGNSRLDRFAACSQGLRKCSEDYAQAVLGRKGLRLRAARSRLPQTGAGSERPAPSSPTAALLRLALVSSIRPLFTTAPTVGSKAAMRYARNTKLCLASSRALWPLQPLRPALSRHGVALTLQKAVCIKQTPCVRVEIIAEVAGNRFVSSSPVAFSFA